MKVAHEKRVAALIMVVLAFATTHFSIGATQAQSPGSIQADFLSIVNAERASLGKTPLSANSQLESAAYLHSKDMGDNDYFDHTSLDGTTFSQRITAAGYQWRSVSENIAMAYGAPSAAKVYDMWRNSPGHYANMIGDYADAGLGVYSTGGYTYYTLDLGRGQSLPTQTPRPTVSATSTPYPTATPTPTPNPPATSTPAPTVSSTPTPKPTTTQIPPLPTQPPTSTPRPTAAITSSATPTQTTQPTTTDTPSPTPEPSTQQQSANPTPDPTATASSTHTASNPEPTSTAPVPPIPTSTIPESPFLLVVATLLIATGVIVKHFLKQ